MGNINKNTAPFCYSEKKYISASLPQKNASTSNGIIYFNPNFPEFRKTMKKICEIGEKASHNNTIQRKTSKKHWPTLPQLCFIWFFPHKKHHVHLLPPQKKKNRHQTHGHGHPPNRPHLHLHFWWRFCHRHHGSLNTRVAPCVGVREIASRRNVRNEVVTV